MKIVVALLILIIITGFSGSLYSQCLSVDFSIAANACLNQTLYTTNSNGTGNYNWDFCSGDFSNTPTTQTLIKLGSAIGRPAVELAKDGNVWYGFYTGTFTNLLYRITYANGPGSAPTFTENLGNISGVLNGPGDVRVLSEDGLWYGIIHNTTNGELLKISFGSHLSNSLSTSSLITGIGGINSGISLQKDGGIWTCVVTATGPASDQMTVLKMGGSLASLAVTDQLLTSVVPNGNNLGSIDVINVCGNWYGFGDNYGNAIVYRYNFGTTLFSDPGVTQLTTLPVANPGRLRIVQEGDNYFLFIVSLDGTISKLDFGTDVSSAPTITNDGTITDKTYGLALEKENSIWTILTISAQTGQIFLINYPNICSATPATSTAQNPTVAYSQPGNYEIVLNFGTGSGNGVKSKGITISSAPAPDISFATVNNCAQNNINFNSSNTSGNLNSYSWDFGDGNTSSSANPIHIFTSAGNFLTSLNVGATNGCQNTIAKTIPVYNPPVASFTLPSPSVFCTNQDYLFINTTSFDSASFPTWQWTVNTATVSSAKNLSYTIPSSTAQQIVLNATIPGCSSQSTQNISTVLPGPAVTFNASQACQLSPVSFTNTTSGTGLNYNWTFGDGNSSTQINATNTYSSFGNFSVLLTANAPNGCQNSTTKTIDVYSKPAPDFSLELPPFSCSGSASQFNDATPNLTDSNIISWAWTFGDASNGTSTLQNPTYVYPQSGNYTAGLTVTTNFNCSATVQKQVTISPSPTPDFSSAVACANQNTQLTDLSGPTIKSRTWKITNGTTTLPASSVANPVYVFPSTGNYTAMLSVTDNNGCISQLSKTIVVPVPLLPAYSFQEACTGQVTLFTNTTPVTSDAQISTNWNFDNQAMATGPTASYTFTSSENVSVAMTVSAQSGCMYTTTKTISIVPVPVAAFTVSSDTGTPPFKVEFTNASANATSYLWQFNDAIQSTSNLTSPSFTYVLSGEYKVLLTAYNAQNCTDTTSGIIKVVPPHADLALNKLSVVPDLVNGGYKLIITVANNGNAIVTNPSVSVRTSDDTAKSEVLSLTLAPAAVATQMLSFEVPPSAVSFVCVTIEEKDDANESNNEACAALTNQDVLMAPYPNPSNGYFYVDWIAAQPGSAVVTIYSIIGEVIIDNMPLNISTGFNNIGLDVSRFHAGIYLISFRYNGGQKSFRVVVN